MNDYQKPKILLVGASGSGKNTVQDYLVQKYGLKPLLSYTTRAKRYPEENTHTFITKEEYNNIKQTENIIAYTYYNGYHYFATEKQLKESDVYIIDIEGIRYLKEHSKIPFTIFYLQVPEYERIKRMKYRGDSEQQIKERISFDQQVFNIEKNRSLYDHLILNTDSEQTAITIKRMWDYESMHKFSNQNIIDTEREIIDKLYQIQSLMLKLNSNIEHIEINIFDVSHGKISNSMEIFGCNYNYITANDPSHILEFKTFTNDGSQTAYLKNVMGYNNLEDVRIK